MMLIVAGTGTITVLIVIALIIFTFMIFLTRFLGLWIQTLISNAPVRFVQLMGMWSRRVDVRLVVLSRIQVVKAGLDIPVEELEAQYLAGGNLQRVVNALIAAKRNGIEMDWDTACAADLAGRDPLAEVQALINR
jgi:uncharacterized protein YqfA (UPF0365 family)